MRRGALGARAPVNFLALGPQIMNRKTLCLSLCGTLSLLGGCSSGSKTGATLADTQRLVEQFESTESGSTIGSNSENRQERLARAEEGIAGHLASNPDD